MKLLVFIALVAVTQAVKYKLVIYTHPDEQFARSAGKFLLSAINYNGDMVDFGQFTNDRRLAGDKTIYNISSDVDLGRIGCFTIRAKSIDKWIFGKACISSQSDEGFCFVNNDNTSVSRDTSVEGDNAVLAMLMCAPPLSMAEVKEMGL